MTVDVSSDTPFGRLDVPLSIEDRKGSRTVWVDLVDGAGTATLDLRRAVETIRVDPDGLLPLQEGTASQGDPAARKTPGAPRVL